MCLARRPGRVTALIAMFAILLAALAPAIAQAFASSQDKSTPWAEVCTSAGMQVRQGLVPTGDSGEHEGPMSGHCSFCSNHSGHLALPATPRDLALPMDAGAASSRAFGATAAPGFFCTSPQSRAPPVFS